MQSAARSQVLEKEQERMESVKNEIVLDLIHCLLLGSTFLELLGIKATKMRADSHRTLENCSNAWKSKTLFTYAAFYCVKYKGRQTNILNLILLYRRKDDRHVNEQRVKPSERK